MNNLVKQEMPKDDEKIIIGKCPRCEIGQIYYEYDKLTARDGNPQGDWLRCDNDNSCFAVWMEEETAAGVLMVD